MMTKSAEDLGRTFLHEYRDEYRRRKALLIDHEKPSLGERVEKESDVPRPPTSGTESDARILKWYAHDGKGGVRYYDDGEDLPGDDEIVVVSRSLAMATANGVTVQTESWVLRRS